jgi:uncharacterized membrane protein YphA (DoxX/SURF4 family)
MSTITMSDRQVRSGSFPKRIIASWVLQIAAALILGQTLFFKFTGSAESVYIFETLGMEPWGRYLSGVMELAAVVLLLIPRAAVIGAALALGVMAGAIASHLGPLGIEVEGDGGLLFALALVVASSSAAILALRFRQIRLIAARVRRFWSGQAAEGAEPPATAGG